MHPFSISFALCLIIEHTFWLMSPLKLYLGLEICRSKRKSTNRASDQQNHEFRACRCTYRCVLNFRTSENLQSELLLPKIRIKNLEIGFDKSLTIFCSDVIRLDMYSFLTSFRSSSVSQTNFISRPIYLTLTVILNSRSVSVSLLFSASLILILPL